MASTNGVSGNETLARLAVQRLQKIANNPVPPKLKEKVSLALIDYLSGIASGLQAPWAPAVLKFAKSRQNGASEAHAWGLNQDIGAESAAFVNATLAHSAIRDDMHLKSNSHIGGITISAALAMAQREHWSGEQLLKGILGGYEMAAVLGSSIQQTPGYNRHVRPSGILGAFGSAAAAVTASNADETTAVNALCFAANMISGFNQWAWTGGMEIYTEMGTASSAGITAYDIAKAGMECSEDLLEGKAGCFAALSVEGKAEQLFRDWLASSEIGYGIEVVGFKPVPGCNYAQTPLAVALRVAKKYQESKKTSADIKEIVIRCTSGAKNYPGCDNPGPFSTVQQTKMSIQYGVSAILVHGAVSEELFQKYDSKEINELVAKCSVTPLPEFDTAFKEGRQPARVEVKLSDGTSITEELPDVPWLDGEAVIKRFYEDTKGLIAADAQKQLVQLIQGLENVKDAGDIYKLFKSK